MTEENPCPNFDKIKQDYLKQVPQIIEDMDHLAEEIEQAPTKETLEKFERYVHNFAGNAATFGYPLVTDLCKEWDAKLKEALQNFSEEKVKPLKGDLVSLVKELKSHFSS